MKEDYEDSTVESWVMSKCEQWRDHYETNYSERFDEYYRTWRGIWDKNDSMRESERSRLIAPATQQAVESSVAEIEEATFGRGTFFDIKDDLQDPNQGDVELLKNQLTEDMHFSKARSSIGECLINAAVFGTGIGELVLDEIVELTAATQPALDGQMTAIGVNKRDRMIVRLDPIMPQNFLIDPLATNIEDALGVVIDKMVPHHQVQQGIDSGIYRDVEIGSAPSESEIEDASKVVYSYNDDMVRLTKYYGLVPTDLLKNQELDENEELQDMVDLDDEDRADFLDSLGVGVDDCGLRRVIREAYDILNLQTYFTSGPTETRAWVRREFSLLFLVHLDVHKLTLIASLTDDRSGMEGTTSCWSYPW